MSDKQVKEVKASIGSDARPSCADRTGDGREQTLNIAGMSLMEARRLVMTGDLSRLSGDERTALVAMLEEGNGR